MKDKRKAPFPIRPSDEVMEWLQQKAKRNERSVNYVVNRILEAAKTKEEGGLI
jgi:predicted HicB family RNase H-like nuclease